MKPKPNLKPEDYIHICIEQCEQWKIDGGSCECENNEY